MASIAYRQLRAAPAAATTTCIPVRASSPRGRRHGRAGRAGRPSTVLGKQELDQSRKTPIEFLAPQPVHSAVAEIALADETRISKNTEMMRTGGLGHRQFERTATALPASRLLSESHNDLPAMRIGQCGQDLAKLHFIDRRISVLVRHA